MLLLFCVEFCSSLCSKLRAAWFAPNLMYCSANFKSSSFSFICFNSGKASKADPLFGFEWLLHLLHLYGFEFQALVLELRQAYLTKTQEVR